jgi:hypothetical protein
MAISKNVVLQRNMARSILTTCLSEVDIIITRKFADSRLSGKRFDDILVRLFAKKWRCAFFSGETFFHYVRFKSYAGVNGRIGAY